MTTRIRASFAALIILFFPLAPAAAADHPWQITSHGAKRILAVGSSIDHQMDYTAAAADFFYDQPLGNGDGLTVQGAYNRYDGGTTFAQLPREHLIFLEVETPPEAARAGGAGQTASMVDGGLGAML